MEAASSPEQRPPALVVADTSEPERLVALIRARGVPVKRQRLAPADFVVGDVAIERKTVADFHASMIDKRLFEQLERLKDAYAPPHVMLLEGDLAFVAEREQPRAFWGALMTAAVQMGITVVPTPDRHATAEVLAILARHMGRTGRRTTVRFRPRMLTSELAQKFAVQGLPGIGDRVSENLLLHFGSVRGVYAASRAELARTPGLGPKRASEITEFLDRAYGGQAASRGAQARLPDEAE